MLLQHVGTTLILAIGPCPHASAHGSSPLGTRWDKSQNMCMNTGDIHDGQHGFELFAPPLNDRTAEAAQWCYLGQTVDRRHSLIGREIVPGEDYA